MTANRPLRIATWNCGMAFHRKADALFALDPDVAVIGECASPTVLAQKAPGRVPVPDVWVGSNPHKGLAVFTSARVRCDLCADHNAALRYIAPTRVTGALDFNLIAAWAQNASAGITRKSEGGPLRQMLEGSTQYLAERPLVLAGDLNSNAIWDKPGWAINHSYKVTFLERLGVISLYHVLSGEPHGKESTPTIYWRDRLKSGPTYHLDYIFVPSSWLGAVRHFEVGSFEAWCGTGLSDHVPLWVDLDLMALSGAAWSIQRVSQ